MTAKTLIVERAEVRVLGDEALPFLQDLVTNDVGALAPDQLVYAALLTPQGKFLFDFFVRAAAGGAILDVATDQGPALARRLMMYRLRRKLEIDVASRQVALIWDADEAPANGFSDPRDPRLGWRVYETDGLAETATQKDHDHLRILCGAPETGRELTTETYILEVGFDRLSGVDFRKGCYVGQEVTARMKHKTTLKKGLARVMIEGEAEEGAEILANGRAAGRLHTVAGDQALAYLRFDRAEGEMTAGPARLTRTD